MMKYKATYDLDNLALISDDTHTHTEVSSTSEVISACNSTVGIAFRLVHMCASVIMNHRLKCACARVWTEKEMRRFRN